MMKIVLSSLGKRKSSKDFGSSLFGELSGDFAPCQISEKFSVGKEEEKRKKK